MDSWRRVERHECCSTFLVEGKCRAAYQRTGRRWRPNRWWYVPACCRVRLPVVLELAAVPLPKVDKPSQQHRIRDRSASHRWVRSEWSSMVETRIIDTARGFEATAWRKDRLCWCLRSHLFRVTSGRVERNSTICVGWAQALRPQL